MALLTQKQFDQTVARIARRGMQLTRDIQAAAVAAIGYSVVHGDITAGQRLFDAMATSLRRDSLVAYLEKYGNFAWMKSDKKFAYYAAVSQVSEHDWSKMEAELMNIAWDKAKRENEIVSAYDVSAEFDKFMKKMEKLRGDATITMHHKALLDTLEDACAKYHARLVLGVAADESQTA